MKWRCYGHSNWSTSSPVLGIATPVWLIWRTIFNVWLIYEEINEHRRWSNIFRINFFFSSFIQCKHLQFSKHFYYCTIPPDMCLLTPSENSGTYQCIVRNAVNVKWVFYIRLLVSHSEWIHSQGRIQAFPNREREPIIGQLFCQNLHENERILDLISSALLRSAKDWVSFLQQAIHIDLSNFE